MAKQRYRAVGVGEALDRKLLRRDWLAQQIGVHHSLITHIIAGRRTVDAERAGRIADALDMPFGDLFELSSDYARLWVEAAIDTIAQQTADAGRPAIQEDAA